MAFLLFCASISAQDTSKKSHNRIITLAPHIAESLYAIGAGDQIIATIEHTDFPDEAKVLPIIGNYARLQIEKIVQLQPDVVIAWRTGNPEEDLARLQKYGLKVVYSHPQKLEDVAKELLMFGDITGQTQAAAKLSTAFLARLEKIRKQYQDAPRVTGFYEMWARPLRTVANRAWLQQQLEVCGVVNPFADLSEDYPLVSLEQVLASEPQVVIQPTPYTPSSPNSLNWDQWPHIPASKNEQIFHPNADRSHRMTSRMLDELEILCRQVDGARAIYYANKP